MKISKIKFKDSDFPVCSVTINELKKSIKETGLLHPILIQNDGKLVAGRQRLEALKELGYSDLKKEQFRVIHHKGLRAELASLDEDLVRKQLSWQQEALALARRKEIYEKLYPETKRGGDRSPEALEQRERPSFCSDTAAKMGLHERTLRQKVELAKMMEEYGDLKECTTAAEARFRYKKRQHEDQRKANSKEVVNLENVFHGDCIEGIKALKDGSVACVLTDPPYGIDYVAKARQHGPIANDNEDAFPLLDKALEELKPKLKKEACLYIFCPWKTVDLFKQIIEKHYEVRNILVWKKNLHGIGDLNSWADIYELIIYATPGRHQVIGTRPVNVLSYDRSSYSFHSCEKPVDLLKFIIEKSTVEGEMVIDPFAGSGSTGVAAKECNRPFHLMELEKQNVDVIHQRLTDAA